MEPPANPPNPVSEAQLREAAYRVTRFLRHSKEWAEGIAILDKSARHSHPITQTHEK